MYEDDFEGTGIGPLAEILETNLTHAFTVNTDSLSETLKKSNERIFNECYKEVEGCEELSLKDGFDEHSEETVSAYAAGLTDGIALGMKLKEHEMNGCLTDEEIHQYDIITQNKSYREAIAKKGYRSEELSDLTNQALEY